ncbi:MAG: hypothetical protein ACJ790_17280 [Myxococcaceae bacterium]
MTERTPREKLTQVFTTTCACGHDKTHKRVRADCTWTTFGYLALAVVGVNPRPKQVELRCTDCGTVFERSRDPEVLEKHRSTPT